MLVLVPLRGHEVDHQSRTGLLGPQGVVHNHLLFHLQVNVVGEMIPVLSHCEVGLLANEVSNNDLGIDTGDIILRHLVPVGVPWDDGAAYLKVPAQVSTGA